MNNIVRERAYSVNSDGLKTCVCDTDPKYVYKQYVSRGGKEQEGR